MRGRATISAQAMRSDAGAEEQFGPYLVYEQLGVGGMATVHRAVERGIEGFERVVALKRLLPHLAADATFIKSFVREAKLASLLNHVNIVQILECGRVGDHYFISMEYIDGRDIRRILRHARKVSGPPPVQVIVGVLLQLCDALEYAHGRSDDAGQPLGLVHRDVSPSNVLVTTTGQVKVIDFGIAKAQSAPLMTHTGRLKGKLGYMAPEALLGKELDARSDLFAAGIVAHELLTARPLFATKNDYQTLSKIQRGGIAPPSKFNQTCPPELDAIVLRALARDPDQRFARASDLRDELHALRRKFNLRTAERDIAAWIDWAFGLDAPVRDHPRAPSKTDVDVHPAPAEPAPRARRSDEEEAIEAAWGAGDDPGNGAPVVLDDAADKHLPTASALGADVCLELDDLADISMPFPAQGPRPASEAAQRAMAAALLARPAPRVRRPTPAMPMRHFVLPASAAEPAAQSANAAPVPQAISTSADGSSRATALPARPRTTTIPPRLPSGSITPVNLRGDTLTGDDLDDTGERRRDTGQRRADIALGSSTRDAVSLRAETPTAIYPAGDSSFQVDSQVTDPAPAFHEELGPSDTIVSIPMMPIPEPVVRFSEPTIPPPSEAPTPPETARSAPVITPATALFAEPDPEPEPVPAPPIRPTVEPDARPAVRPDRDAERPRGTWRMLIALVALALVGAALTAGALQLLRSRRAIVEVVPDPPPVTSKTVGTVEFSIAPPDSAITINGKPVHRGTPWTVELEPGVYQIEIRHDGYMGWLTSIELAAGEVHPLHVTLEPLGTTIDATLSIGSMPQGLEVVIDGASAGKTPLKRALSAGPHAIALRRNGVEVWRKTLDAQESAVYEIRPTIAPPDPPEPAAEPPTDPPQTPPTPPSTDSEPAAAPPADPEPR